MAAKTTKPAKTAKVETRTDSEMEAIREQIRREERAKMKAELREELKQEKAAKRKARTTIGFNPVPVDADAPDGWNTLARCTFVAEGIGAMDGAIVFAREGGYRAGSAVGAVFGVPGDTATGDTPEAAVDALESAMLAKVAAFAEHMRGYLAKTAAEAVKAGRVYRERQKPVKPEAAKG